MPPVKLCWQIPVTFHEAYTVACIELFRRLWVELERVSVAEDTSHPESASVTCRFREEIVRLELALLLDACRSERWRMHLDVSELSSLQSTLEGVLDALNASSEQAPRDAIAQAQNCLLDAVLEHCAAYPSTAARTGAARVSSTNSRSVVRDHH